MVVENIVRHFHLPQNKGRNWSAIAVEAVNEVGNPTILATFAVIAAVLPMAFVGGLMGPYMRPIPIGASAAMFCSLLIAFIVTPWAAIRILRWGRKYSKLTAGTAVRHRSANLIQRREHPEDFFTRLYRRMMGPLIAPRRLALDLPRRHHRCCCWRAMAPVGIGWVKVKMLPFDNKSEFQIILNMPEGSVAGANRRRPRARSPPPCAPNRRSPTTRSTPAPPSPFNFNGLVRHYFMRRGANVADIQVNLVPKHERKAQSHDIAKRVRPRVAAIAAQIRRARRRRRGAARPARAADARRRNLRPEPRQAATRWPDEVHRHLQATRRASWTSTGTSRPTSPRRASSSTRKRPRCTASAPRRSRRRCASPSAARPSICCTMPREKEDVNIVPRTAALRAHHARGTARACACAPATPTPCPNPAPPAPPPLIPLRELVTRRARPSPTRASTTRT